MDWFTVPAGSNDGLSGARVIRREREVFLYHLFFPAYEPVTVGLPWDDPYIPSGHINQMPIELVTQIFRYYMQEAPRIPEILALVCRAWYHLATNIPSLWSDINLEEIDANRWSPVGAEAIIVNRIHRSHPLPFSVHWNSFDDMVSPYAYRNMAAIPGFSARLRNLVISSEDMSPVRSGYQPALETIEVGPRVTSQIVTELFKDPLELPNMKTLTIGGMVVSACPSVLIQQLERFTVTFKTFKDFDGFQPTFLVLQNTPRLRHLDLLFDPSSMIMPFESIEFHHKTITDLIVSYKPQRYPHDPRHAINPIHCPRLVHFALSIQHTLALEGLTVGRMEELQHLSLTIHSRAEEQDARDIFRILIQTPNLLKLEISALTSVVMCLISGLESRLDLCPTLSEYIWIGIQIDPHENQQLKGRISRRYDIINNQSNELTSA